ncbi:MAG: 50S ribosome-binding GTPase [Candidatus Shikimatogenerans sp. JK-2022]|nr:50S ribosome-binding GTPase [Candidatus Shikimatogenerans bostrichidophilus]
MLYNNIIDKKKIYCISGKGGNGIIHFNKKNKKLGKPDGGNGGDGGDVIIIGNNNINNLYNINNTYKAYNGYNGKKNCKTGKKGKNIIIYVPLNIKIKIKNKIFNIKRNKQSKIIIKGGKGGKGNYYYKNSKNQKSRKYSKGKKGKSLFIYLILKLNIDIMIIGLPNTGKSTILSLITNTKPKIDNYYFTTLIPNIGIYKIKKYIYKQNKFIIMDTPSIYNNIYNNKKLNNKYIKKYIKNIKLLLIIINFINIKIFYKEYIKIKKILLKNNININNKNKLFVFNKINYIKKKNLLKIKNKLKYNYNYCFFTIKKNLKKNIYNLKKKINFYL